MNDTTQAPTDSTAAHRIAAQAPLVARIAEACAARRYTMQLAGGVEAVIAGYDALTGRALLRVGEVDTWASMDIDELAGFYMGLPGVTTVLRSALGESL